MSYSTQLHCCICILYSFQLAKQQQQLLVGNQSSPPRYTTDVFNSMFCSSLSVIFICSKSSSHLSHLPRRCVQDKKQEEHNYPADKKYATVTQTKRHT